MPEGVLTDTARERLRSIHRLSAEFNRMAGKDHNERLFELVMEHAEEIRELYKNGNRHFLIETGDLAVLCFELLLENQADMDGTMRRCFERYEKKLTQLIQEEKRER